MQTDDIISAIDGQIAKLEQVKDLLLSPGSGTPGGKQRGRPKESASQTVEPVIAAILKKGKRRMSDEARARIGAAQKKRWAKQNGSATEAA